MLESYEALKVLGFGCGPTEGHKPWEWMGSLTLQEVSQLTATSGFSMEKEWSTLGFCSRDSLNFTRSF